jgi:hypothetical protein
LSKIHPKVAMDIFVLNPVEAKSENPYLTEIFTYGKIVYEKRS